MRVFRGLDNLPAFNNTVATMGSFDGVHCGHRELLRRVMAQAKELNGESIVITFDPHPRYVLGTGDRMQLLSTLDEKLWLLEQAGIDNVIIIPFTKEFSQTSPQEFIEKDIARIGIKTLVVGYNHRFGHKKEGDYDFLEQRSRFNVLMVEQQQMADSKVSSTIIRQALSRGQVEKAAKLLAHPYIITCEMSGDGAAKSIDSHKLLPAEGRYDATIDGKGVELTIDDKRTLKITPAPNKGKVTIEIK
jgi:riboflavin kinase/FMN adenylyltransferase